jgi:hypothetical protein
LSHEEAEIYLNEIFNILKKAWQIIVLVV